MIVGPHAGPRLTRFNRMDKLAGPVDGIMCNHVTFLPGARTYWHHHENGQILEVKAGSGWVCDKGGKPQRISVGDIVQCPAKTVHCKYHFCSATGPRSLCFGMFQNA